MQFNEQLIDLPNLHQVIDRYPLTISVDSHVVDAIILMNQEHSNSLELINFSAVLPRHKSSQKETSYVLVVEETQLVGIFTLRDVLRLTAFGLDLSRTTMAEVMTKHPITLKNSEFQDISTAFLLLKQYQIHHLPIVDDGGELLGIITESSLLQQLDLVKIVGIAQATQQYLGKSINESPNDQQIERVVHNTQDLLQSRVEEQVAEEIKVTEELQQTLEEMQIFEEEIIQQNEQLGVAHEIAELERRRYQDLFQFTPYGYVVTDKLGLIQEANYAASLLLSVDQNYLIGKPITIFIGQPDRQNITSQLKNFQQFQEWEVELEPRHGESFPANVRISAMYDSQKQWCGWCWLLCNITERRQAEAALRRTSEQLEQKVAERIAELVIINQALQQEIIEHQQTELALRESEERFRQFGENIQAQIIWIKSCNSGATVYVNSAYEKIWGRSCQSLREQPLSWKEAIHPEDRDRILTEIDESHQKGESASLQYRIIQPNGEIRWIWGRCFPVQNQQGELEYCGSITEDITEYKQVEEERSKTQERLTLALEAANMGIWDWEIQTNQTLWSSNMGPIYGLPSHTLCPSPENFLYLIYPEDRNNFTKAVKLAIEQKTEFVSEHRVIWSDGSLHWLSARGKVYYDENDQPARMLGTTREISERKQAEQKIHEQAALLDIATDAIFVRDFQTEILFWNQGAEKIYGWQNHEAMGKNFRDIFYSTTSPQPEEVIALQTVVKSGTWHGELRRKTKFGQEIMVESRWTLMFDAEGQPKSILIVDTDITKKKELEEQFYRTQRLESIGTLAGGIAHDINNILTPILGAAQLLKGRLAHEQERHPLLLTIIENNAKRGAGLVKQVLSFARGLKGERAIVQVKHLIADVIQIGRQTFPKSIEFAAQISEDLWAVSGDTTQLHQVLMNLVVNARDAMPEGGCLQITAENLFIDETYTRMNFESKVGHHIVITITDTGIGMTPEILNRIFEPFFTTKEVGTGTGLGLSTVLGIIKSHDGFITVSSEVAKGSTFKIFLPSVEEPQIPAIEDLEMHSGQGELILVVDDEPQIRDVAKIILEQYNYQTITASNGIEAIALYAQHKKSISAVLMDMMMPEMDGITAIRTLQRMNPQVQVIACSGLSTIEVLPESANTEVQAVLFKPYTANDLLRNIDQIIRKAGV
ncbi:PAS domain S-box protein [Anabaena cylindrica FACHB-243]|uniref:histidine kinase n=1 Tax=Anabaena cylindrica (strain ATCC 27899 / PCC 7122) TaxID=272123 RepID=K9ZK05_ANACC|nr:MULTISPECIES: PAS domain S-box protein [Anabaena]AFZ59573.1 multi-sensor hybrid histidine kinase [Anabaena cylindrica PCC 7122]MBD2418762.1 PAS domain S-box protein [Anabaena cylindrica FACHB-243]MBY5284748.1 PAS domain S-box protein [Anabaena sp. CCAP 1446/1C]MBY5310858.1 PAS domain S-box protein [Anabaena sp. CCAP 1446/1C]MCM2406327.1 PAS domain S-box protein [Anabaena sp. CCAP 1446/1C]